MVNKTNRYRQTAVVNAWLLAGLTGTWTALTVIFAWGVANAGTPVAQRFLPANASDTVAFLRFLSEGVAILLASLVANSLELSMWGLAGTQGVAVSTMLGMSSRTGFNSLCRLLKWAQVPGIRDHHRFWVAIRLLSIIMLPLMGIIVLSRVNPTTIYNVNYTYSATAGIGSFNESVINDWVSSGLTIVTVAQFRNLIWDTTNAWGSAPVDCQGLQCSSYYFPGSTGLIAPSIIPRAEAVTKPIDTVIVHDAQGVHIDFWDYNDTASAPICQNSTYGGSDAAIYLEICKSSNVMEAWWVNCDYNQIGENDMCFTDKAWMLNDGWGTAMAVYTSTADTFYSLFNGSILSVNELSRPIPENISPYDLISFFNLILPEITNTTLDLNYTSSAFVAYICQYMSTANRNDQDVVTLLRSFLTAPLLLLHNDNPNLYTPATDTQQGPPQFSVTVDFAQSWYQVTIAKWTFIMFFSIAGSLFLGCLVLLFSLTFVIGTPVIALTSFPLIDFMAQLLPGPNSFISLLSNVDTQTNEALQSNLEKVAVQLKRSSEHKRKFELTVISHYFPAVSEGCATMD